MHKQCKPIIPISWIPSFWVKILHMVISLISDINNLIHKLSTKLCPLLQFVFLLVNFQLATSFNHFSYFSLRCLLHFKNQTLFFFNCNLIVIISSLLVLCFPKFTILDNYVFTLSGSPCFIIKFLFLSTLSLYQVKQ